MSFVSRVLKGRQYRSFAKSSIRTMKESNNTNLLACSNRYKNDSWSYASSAAFNYDTRWLKHPLALLGVCLGISALIDSAENCGIVGVVGNEDASGFILEGLTILRNRGYDSAGMATIAPEGGELTITKYASRDTTADSIDLVRAHSAKHHGDFIGIGHTRWATHGGKTDFNAHPHTDQHQRIAVIHNGTINNSYDLKKELIDKGIKFTSETDTEVIAQLIGLNLDKGMDTKEAVAAALSRYHYDKLNICIF